MAFGLWAFYKRNTVCPCLSDLLAASHIALSIFYEDIQNRTR